jgi:hypothetical protein
LFTRFVYSFGISRLVISGVYNCGTSLIDICLLLYCYSSGNKPTNGDEKMMTITDIILIIIFIPIILFFVFVSVMFTAVVLSELFQPIIPGIKPPLGARIIRLLHTVKDDK